MHNLQSVGEQERAGLKKDKWKTVATSDKWKHTYTVSNTMKKALKATQTLGTAYAGGVRPPPLYQIWSGLLNSFKSY